MKKKVCRNCKIFVKGEQCPLCKNSNFSESFSGRINILDAEKSEIAKKINIKTKGEFCIKIR